ncbi:MEDS domain-containing protein [Planosporangium sp. 12N6]|uniref:MEDS domain-containing protein n=1 Tax=Planosporangium spinosum TaxID=3402278 RepID=UPI003CF7F70B
MKYSLPRPPGPEWDGHLLLLHGSEAERLSSLAAWICRGLDHGDKVVYAEVPRTAGESVLDSPDGCGVEFAAAVADGRLVALPLERFYSRGDQESVVDQALAEGFRSVRMATEASATFGTESWSAYLDIERTIDRLCRTRPVSALCQYAHAATAPATLRELVAVHRARLRHSALNMASDPRGLVLSGEIDCGNADAFAAALAIASACGERMLRLDLTALEFMDVTACRQLLHASHGFRQAGGHVILEAPRWMVSWTLRLLGIDQFAGIDLLGGEQ